MLPKTTENMPEQASGKTAAAGNPAVGTLEGDKKLSPKQKVSEILPDTTEPEQASRKKNKKIKSTEESGTSTSATTSKGKNNLEVVIQILHHHLEKLILEVLNLVLQVLKQLQIQTQMINLQLIKMKLMTITSLILQVRTKMKMIKIEILK